MKGIHMRGSKIGEDEIKGFAKQIDYIEKMSLDQCDFQGHSFFQMCDAIRCRNGKVSEFVLCNLFLV